MSAMDSSSVPIAIIGMSCRFAGGVDNPEKLWELCAEGRSAWTEIPSSRFNLEGVYHPNNDKSNTLNVRGGHFLSEDPALFDANFFNLSAELAASIDPQFRLQLETTYEAFESAGLRLQDVAGSKTSVFAGAFFRDYIEGHMRDPDTLPRFLLMGVGAAMASNRISHFYDLRGPSMTIDTGCSTTLTAFHQACQSLRTGESDMSVVGGANVLLNPDMFVIMSSLTLLSAEGKSFAFDSRASGYGHGEGSATVILKRLDDALRDGDPIRAVIRETGANQDGKTETITTPSREAQEALIREVYNKAGLDPSETTYFEAHGTGTPTGDPIEAEAIASVFKDTRKGGQPLRLGSIKTNIGHTETASGLASIVKVALAMEKGQIPPSINFEKPNPKLHLDKWKLKVPTQLESWPDDTGIRRASVNNFGYGGSNAHVIMEDYASYVASSFGNGSTATDSQHNNRLANGHTNGHTNGVSTNTKSRVFILSARDQLATESMLENLKSYLLSAQPKDEDNFLDSLAYTLGQRRTIFPWISALPAQNVSGLVNALGSAKSKPVRTPERPRLGFVFTGQGAQWWAMGRELIGAYPTFKASLIESERYLKELGAPWSLLEELQRDAESTRVSEPTLSMPVCVALQIALVELLQSWDITPTAVSSHSSGEIAAAYTAGALSQRSAIGIAFARGQLVAEGRQLLDIKGGMIAVGLSPADCEKYISRVSSGQLVAACMNSPTSTTVSGDVPGIEELEALLQADGVFARRLRVDAAYHSHHMEAIADIYESFLEEHVKPEGPEGRQGQTLDIIYASPTTGRRMSVAKELCAPIHWVRSLIKPVRFVEAFQQMCFADPSSSPAEPEVDMEILTMPNFGGRKVSYGTCLVRKTNAVDTMHTLVCDLIRRGHPVNMNAVNFPFGRHGVRVLHDLPHYPWNHQSRYWSEPRQNKAHRHRLDAPHDLLGSLVLGTNATAPSWRNIIKESDLPWVHDHLVQSNIVYPGAGFICMAIEGALQQASRAGATKKVVSYRLRDVDILQALVIPDTAEGVEVQLELRPCREKAIYAKGWKEFTVYSVSGDNKWTEHCQGLISVELASSASEDTPARWDDNNAWSAAYLPLTQPVKAVDYRMRIAARDIYAGMRSVGIYHGPIFQNLKSVRARHNQSTSVFEIADSASVMPHQHQHPHVLHPTTLDSVFQTAYTAMPESRSVMTSAMVPRFIKSMTVAHDIQSSPGHRFRSYADIIHKDSHSLETKIVVYDDRGEEGPGNDQRPLIQLNGFVLQSLGKAGSRSADPHENEKFSTVRWAPDITFLPPAYLKQELGCPIQPSEAEIIMDLRRACSYFIDDALASLTVDDIANLEWHHKKFYNWMKVQKELASTNQLAPGSSEWAHHSAAEKRALIEKVNAASVNGEMVCRLGPQILSMLRREITPLELMLEGKLLHRYYVDALKWDRSSRQMGELVRHYVHKQPRAKILEIGGGTGGTTTYNLNAIGSSDSGHGPLAASYDFTDISSGFFEAAQDKFQAWKDLVRYRKLDIEQDPASQGFETGTYDLIMASQVLHATKSMQHTMGNVHKLLKPGGKLFIMETTKDQLDLQLAFGLLPGWWLSEEEERKLSPSLSIDMWDRVLRRTGFSGVEMEVHDAEDENLYSFSVMMSTAMAPDAGASSADVLLVLGFQTPPQDWLEALQSSIVQVTGTRPAVEVSFPSANLHGKICIYLGDMGHSVLHDPDPEQFEALKVLCTQSKGLLWVTQGGMMEHEDLHASLSTGFLRSLREEYVGKYLVALDLDPKQEAWSRKSIDPLIAVLKNTLDHSAEETYRDFEFAERDGVLHVPRYVKDVARNEARAPDLDRNCTAARAPFEQPGRSLRLSVGTPGLLDTLAFSDDPDATTDLHPDQLEVEPRAFGVNFRDIMVAMGQLGSEQTMCFECAGVVKRAGANAAAQGFRAGDRIMTLLRGHYANLVRLPWTNAVHIPDSLSFETAASLPMVYTTAYVSLIETAQLEQGERVLIHAATGGVGQAAIVLAKLRGAEIFATVGTKEKRDFLVSKYGIAPDHIFSSRDTSFGPAVLAMTDGQGVDVVLNSLAGPLLQESFNCVAPFGRFVEIGKRDLEINSSLEMGAFNRAVSFFHIDLLQLEAHKGAQIQRVMKEIVRLFSEGSITTVDPVTVYPLSDLGKTFRLMQAGKHMGKIVVTVKADDLVPVLPVKPVVKLCANATYLIVGGLGGIGQSICYWMAKHGAKNLIVISRSAAAQGKASPVLSELSQLGCRVRTVGCDIANDCDLAKALWLSSTDMPPIRGVIQGTMVLRDSILEQMTIEEYNAAIRPKVHGSWNLHQLFKGRELDFFVMLSSLAGIIGHPSQSNYSAGGTFQDALARHRVAHGLPAASIDLGVVSSVGYVAEHDGTAERLKKSGHTLLSEDDVLFAIESAITSPFSGQILLGLNTGPGAHWEESSMSRDLRFAPLRYRQLTQVSTGPSAEGISSLASQIAAATTFADAAAAVVQGIAKKLGDIFMIEEQEISSSKALSKYGVDSLVAVELRNMLALRAGSEISIFDIMQSPSIAKLGELVVAKSSHLNPSLLPSQ